MRSVGSPLRALNGAGEFPASLTGVAAEGSPTNRTIQALPLDIPNLQVWHSPPPRPSVPSDTPPALLSDGLDGARGALRLHEADDRGQGSEADDRKHPLAGTASAQRWLDDGSHTIGFAL